MAVEDEIAESERALDIPSTQEQFPGWQLQTRIVFRFCFVYFGLYVATTQMLPGMLPLFRPLQLLPPMRPLVQWTASHVFHIRALVLFSGSGDKYFDWVHAFCLLCISVIAATVWSVAGRRRAEYRRLFQWLRVFLRFALGTTMISYGFSKVFPLQMPYPQLTRLVEPFGNFSPMGVLWYSIGAAPAYEIFVGAMEVVGGVLLFVPRTALLGAAVCLADTIAVFALNMTYDVPVKLFSFHLILVSIFLLAPCASRLLKVFLGQAAGPSTQLTPGRTQRGRRLVFWAQLVAGLLFVAMNMSRDATAWYMYGGGAKKTQLYGIWNVDQMMIDGRTRAPLLTDYDRWRRVIIDSSDPTAPYVSFHRMDDTFVTYAAKIDATSITLTNSKTTFALQRPGDNHLVLDGNMDGHSVRMELRLVDRNSFLLVNRGFHWVQERPFNR